MISSLTPISTLFCAERGKAMRACEDLNLKEINFKNILFILLALVLAAKCGLFLAYTR